MATEPGGVIHRRAETRNWKPTSYPGIEMCGLRRNETAGGAVLLRIAKGARFPMHDHPGGEEVFVVQGRAVIAGVVVNAGDYLWTPAGGVHDLVAQDETLLFVSSPNGIRVAE